MATAIETAQAVVDAADAWILENLENHEAVFSYTVNGRTFQSRGYDEVMRTRDHYAGIVRALEGRSRTFATFEDC